MKSKIKRIILDNGLKVIFDRLPYHRKCTIRVGINVGSYDESLENFGVAHFVEHMFYKSTNCRLMKEIFTHIDKAQADDDANTDTSITDFALSCLPRYLPDVIKIMFETINNFDFDEDEIEREKNGIITEIYNYADQPATYQFDYVFIPAVFGKTALSRQICALPKSIKKINKEDLIKFKSRFYQPKNMAIVVSGCFNEERVFNILGNTFGKLIGAYSEIYQPIRKLPGRKYWVIKRKEDINQIYLTIGLPILNFYELDDEKVAALSLWQTLLFGGLSTRLFYRLCAEDVDIYSNAMSVELENWEGVGLIYFRIKGLRPKRFSQIIKKIFEEIRFVNLNVIKREEMEIAKGLLIDDYRSDKLQDVNFRADEILNKEFGFASYDFCNIIKEVKKMHPRRFRSIIRKYIPYSRRKWTIAALVPKGFRFQKN